MVEEALNYDTALTRYLDGCCPRCGEKMEYRENKGDHFCHRCKESWRGEKVLALRKTLPLYG